jgi:hypothetical protein
MRLAPLVAVFVPALSLAQIWEKPVAPGITYKMVVDQKLPRVIHALKFSRDAGVVTTRPELASGKVFNLDEKLKGRETLTKTVERTGAVAGINADFFPWSGDPLGAMVADGELMCRPYPGRSAFAWGPGYSHVSRLDWKGRVVLPSNESLELDGMNELCAKNLLVLDTSRIGYALTGDKSVSVFLEAPTWTPNGKWECKVMATMEDEPKIPVGRGQAVLTGCGTMAEKLKGLSKGDMVTVELETKGFDWAKAKNIVGGGPVIVDKGKPLQAWDAENFNAEFATKRHPRTAIGFDAAGDVWMVVVEGRQTLSIGATLSELAEVMSSLGCIEALNLDGGGSSEIALAGMVVNRPSDGSERPIANSILVYSNLTQPVKPVVGTEEQETLDYVIQGKPRLLVGTATDYRVFDSKGRQIPTASIIWSAQGDGWIDQSGRLRPIQTGLAKISAWINGKVLTLDVKVEGPVVQKK